jgi:hypothetical protein
LVARVHAAEEVPPAWRQRKVISQCRRGSEMDECKTLIEKLSRELEAMRELIDSAYTLESPEVLEAPMLSLDLSIAETRLIRDVLQRYDPPRVEPCC